MLSKNYLVVKTDENAPETTVVAKDENNSFLFQLQIKACSSGTPFYLDVKRFKGKSISFNDNEFIFDGETDYIPECDIEAQNYRPTMHYTVPYGWLNDPNGLIFANGKYHIFCQHNPLSTVWGNMHWHHSITEDFIHFEHLGDALFPDEEGTMFSGSAIKDINNVSSLGKDAILLFYTIASYSNETNQPKFSQGLAFSKDGINFEKYSANPIVPNIVGENRDPKVVFVPEMNTFVMALYLENNEYCLLKSDNLLNWQEFQRINIENDSECPDLYYLEDSKKWILSGASDYYIIGHFEKNGFVTEQNPVRYYQQLDERLSYAAQSFSGLNNRTLRLTWENINPENHQSFCGQLSLPMEMSLVSLQNGERRLKSTLCREIESRLKTVYKGCLGKFETHNPSFIADINYSDEDFSINIDETVLKISPKNNSITYKNKAIPLYLSGKRNIRIIVDKISIEILADDGLIFSCIKSICNKDKRTLNISGGKTEISVFEL